MTSKFLRLFSFSALFCLFAPFIGFAQITYDFESGVTGFGSKTVSQPKGGYTFSMTALDYNLNATTSYIGGALNGTQSVSPTYLSVSPAESSITVSMGGVLFDLTSFKYKDVAGVAADMVLTSSKGAVTIGTNSSSITTLDVAGNANSARMKGISSFTITIPMGYNIRGDLDDFVISNIVGALPTVTTSAVSSITSSSAVMGGNVTDAGGVSITDRGVVYGASVNPTTSNNKVQNGTGLGAFSQTISGLTPGATYNVRAYAINSGGTSYGANVAFTIAANPAVSSSSTNLAACITTYGTPSPTSPSNFISISGTNLLAGVLVTPSSEFEVSKDNTNFSNTVTIGAAGTPTLSAVPVYIRLKAATAAGTYSGKTIVLSSTSLTNVNVSIPTSTVNQAPLTITAPSPSKVYGAPLPTFTPGYAGFVNGENISVLITAPAITTTATSNSSVNGNPYTITASGALAANYTISYVAGSLTITPKPLTITANSASKAYGATLPVLTASYSGFVNGETSASLITPPTLATTATATSSVAGSPYTITASGAIASNYTISYVAGSLTVTRVALTITANNQTKAYGAVMPALTASYSGFVNGETSAILTTPPSLSTSATTTSPVAGSPYLITASGAVAANYTISYVAGSLTITAVPLLITANNQTKIYGAPISGLTASYAGFVNGETSGALTVQPTLNTVATATSSVAGSPYSITASGAVASNYAISYAAGNMTVTPAPLTIKANDQTKTYGAGIPTLTASYIGFMNGETSAILSAQATLSTTATTASPVSGSPYPITASGALAANYAISYLAGNFAVTPTPLSITATGPTKSFGTALVAGTSTTNFTSGATQNGELVTQVTLTPDAAGLSAATPAGSAYTVTPSAAVGSNGFLVSNYNVSYIPFNGPVGTSGQSIAFAPLASVTYGANPVTLTGTASSGLVVSYISSDPNVATISGAVLTIVGAGTTNITAKQSGSGNFTAAADVMQSFTVDPKNLSITANDAGKTYGQTLATQTGATGFTSLGLVGVQSIGSVTLNYGPGSAGTDAVGIYAGSILPSAATGGTFNPNNYTISYAAGNLTIGTSAITITADAQTKIYGTPDPALTYTVTSGALVGTDAFTGNLSRTTGEHVGTYAIAQGNVSLNSNYVLSYATGNLVINPAPLTVSATGPAKAFGTALVVATSTANFIAGATPYGEIVSQVLLTPNAAGLTANTPAGANYTVTPSAAVGTNGFLASNYNISYVAFNGTVGTSTQNITFGTLASATYGNSPIALTGTASSGLTVSYSSSNPLVATVSGNVVTIVGAGTTTITASQPGNPNYVAATAVQQSFTVVPKTLTVTANAAGKIYGQALTVQSASTLFTASGLVGSQSIGSVTITYGSGALATDAVGLYAGSVVASTATGGTFNLNNYSISYLPGDLTVSSRAVTVTANAQTKIYGDADPTLSYSIGNGALVGTDTFNGSLSRIPGNNIGTYAITQGNLSLSSNYVLSYVPANLIITAKSITVSADAKTKIYGSADPILSYTFSPALVSGDIFSGGLIRNPGETNGNYTISQGSLALNGNYVLHFTGNTFTIGKAALVITADSKTKLFGADNPALTASYTGFVNGETPAVLSSPVVLLTTAVKTSVAGTYPIVASGAIAANYDISFAAGSLKILETAQSISFAPLNSKLSTDVPFALTATASSGLVVSFTSSDPAIARIVNGNQVELVSFGTVTITAIQTGDANYIAAPPVAQSLVILNNPAPILTITSSKGNSLSKGESTILSATGAVTYQWASANGIISGQNAANLSIRPSTSTTYTVTGFNQYGRSSTQSIQIEVLSDYMALKISNIVTPNGDGINDRWLVENIDLYPNNLVKIIDKSGKLVYEKRGYDNSWDGNLNGAPLTTDTYYFFIDFGPGIGLKKGFITLLR